MKRVECKTGESSGTASGQTDIEDALQHYEAALNASDADAVLAVFALDGL